MNALQSDDWSDEPDDFYDKQQFYDDYQTFLDGLIEPVFNTKKIVEIIDTGSDARSPGLGTKNNMFTRKPAKANNTDDSKAEKNMQREAELTRRSGGDARGGHGNQRNLYFSTNDDADSLNKNSLDNRVVSSITFNVADREPKGANEEEYFEDFEDVDEIESREVQSKKRFTDRAVDSDCSSGCSIENNSSVSSTTVNLRRKNLKVRTQEMPSSKSAKTKKLTKSHESVDDKLLSANKSRAKTGRWSKTNSPSSAVRNSRVKEDVRSKKNLPQFEQKLGSISRTIIKEKKVKSTKERSEIPRPVTRVSSKRVNSHVAKKPSFEGSRLPVWQGCHGKSKIKSNLDNIRIKIVEDEDDIRGMHSHTASAVEENSISDGEKTTIDKTRKVIVEDYPEEIEDFSAKSSKLVESVDSQRVKFEREEIKEGPQAKSTVEIEGIVEAQGKAATKGVADSNVGAKKKVEDQSKSDLWSSNYEEAFAKGRAVGLKVYRMAKAAREERKREFRKYGFEDYKRRPREKPQEILDIGVSLVEKVIDDGNENDHGRDYTNVRDTISRGYFISQLNFQ